MTIISLNKKQRYTLDEDERRSRRILKISASYCSRIIKYGKEFNFLAYTN